MSELARATLALGQVDSSGCASVADTLRVATFKAWLRQIHRHRLVQNVGLESFIVWPVTWFHA